MNQPIEEWEEPTPRNIARAFLGMHHGSCSVPASSALGIAFAGLQVAGEVELRLSSTAGYVDVYVKGYTNQKKL